MIRQEEDGSYVVQESRKKQDLTYRFAVVRGRIYMIRKSNGGDERDERRAREALKTHLRKAAENLE